MGGTSYKGIPKTPVSSQPVDVGDADVVDGDGYDNDASNMQLMCNRDRTVRAI